MNALAVNDGTKENNCFRAAIWLAAPDPGKRQVMKND